MAQKRKLDYYDDDFDFDTESLSRFESDEDFVHSISSSEDDTSDEENFSSVRQWCKIDSSSPAPSRFSFTDDVGMKACVTNISDPLEYFELFFTDEIVNHIVTETNIFAAENLNKFKSKEHSRTHHWSETNANELRVFFATLILQGIITKPTVKMFWSKRKLIETPSFSNLMSSRRFDLIMQFIHFDRNENTDSSHPQPKLKKIWTVLNYLLKKFSEVYTPEQDICIDESLLLYKGRLSWTQYLPIKRARFGIKMFMLCESHSGYVWSIIIYVGKGTDVSEENKECSFSTQVVLTLSKPLLNKGYCLTMDNYYNSPELGEMLLKYKTDFFGTLRPNRKDLPKELKTEKLKKGDLLAYQRGKMMTMRWRDKKYVHFISSIHNPEIVTVPNKLKNGEIEKPKIVLDYNNTMVWCRSHGSANWIL
ncbi:piggyBac transposable element-derived protein 4 [Trichonephila clavipes]|nr:piggyBac transposable element-derived protein 4 [Trichonephila clavipes]